ncbi:MAG: SDR family NAD(P)-dependent oxidoreductase, partial [Candidatus Binatia bacterium]
MPRKDRLDIARKRILLVGATGVLGRVYAEELAARGASLVVADRPGSGVQVLAGELPGKVAAVEIDVADEASVTRGVREAVDFLGGLDAAISNAAATGEGLIGKGNAFAPFEE